MNILRELINRGYWNEADGEGGDLGGQDGGQPAGSDSPDDGGQGGNDGLLGGDGAKPTGSPGAESSWRDGIKDESLQNFVKNFNTPEDLAKSALQFRQKLSNAITMPGKDASEDDIREFYSKLGVPESPDKYEFQLPEERPETVTDEVLNPILGTMREALHKAGATPQVAQAALQTAVDLVVGSHQKTLDGWSKSYQDGVDALKQEWGADFEMNNNYAQRAYKQFHNEEFGNLLDAAIIDGKPLKNHPALTKVFADIGRKMGEGGLQYVASETDVRTFEENQDKLTREAHAAIERGDRSKADQLFRQRDEEAQRYYGSQ